MERDLIRERTLDGLRADQAQVGAAAAALPSMRMCWLACARQSRGESVTAIARHLKVGRSTLYRALRHMRKASHRLLWSRCGKGPGSHVGL